MALRMDERVYRLSFFVINSVINVLFCNFICGQTGNKKISSFGVVGDQFGLHLEAPHTSSFLKLYLSFFFIFYFRDEQCVKKIKKKSNSMCPGGDPLSKKFCPSSLFHTMLGDTCPFVIINEMDKLHNFL